MRVPSLLKWHRLKEGSNNSSKSLARLSLLQLEAKDRQPGKLMAKPKAKGVGKEVAARMEQTSKARAKVKVKPKVLEQVKQQPARTKRLSKLAPRTLNCQQYRRNQGAISSSSKAALHAR
jgi:hypothetical protein